MAMAQTDRGYSTSFRRGGGRERRGRLAGGCAGEVFAGLVAGVVAGIDETLRAQTSPNHPGSPEILVMAARLLGGFRDALG
jgi:hypothetical protein